MRSSVSGLEHAPTPTYDEDLYRRAALLDPYPHYARLRALGPVVRLPRHRAFAVSRHAECKQVLLDDETFRSGAGVAMNPVINRMSRGTTLNSDGKEHQDRRDLVAHRLTPRALRAMEEVVDEKAAAVVDAALSRRHVDAVDDLARALPVAVVPDLVGWPLEGRDQLLRWAAATFDVLGPANRRAVRAVPAALAMTRFTKRVSRTRTLLPDSMGADLLRAVDEGRIGPSECPALLIDYVAPSLDTTISAISSAVRLLAEHRDQWALLKDDPSLVKAAVNEVVRFTSPIRAFSRRVHGNGVTLAGTPLPAGSRVLVLYASANRDERVFPSPDTFDITRDTSQQLGFGHGAHGCAGQGLARMETAAILRQLLAKVERIELRGTPTWGLNNVVRTHSSVPVELVPAASAAPDTRREP
ncbi:cytochrome P450 [Modestobacter sp. I12A-02628]|uniref:Cytochrome P450 n=1 Tax=Goekera deserti TaxID=2497753 RepID=A0A7K3WFI9_9ACTN|nr:cytochrome P450 [Goekera deserti]MPR00021.1 cytochrome P450 [Goekera deserti]NDI49800.1 cytochrome P450 [Goekera deserti]NEL55162.1 cytochrome P450 [Goekera deserti]